MDDSRVEVTQLLRRDPQAWTALLSSHEGLEDVVVTAVTAQPIMRKLSPGDDSPRVTRYVLMLANHSEPITLIAKETTAHEAYFYRDLASQLPTIAPLPYLTHIHDERGWIILDDVPNHVARGRWSATDVENVVNDIVTLHTRFWNRNDLTASYQWLPHLIDRERVSFDWQELRSELGPLFEEGPAAMVSDHALHHLGRLAPSFVEAANGVAVMRALGGWPGVFGESHLAAASDLLDDPVPMLEPLSRLPQTLLHGDMHIYHWHITLFDARRLLDWSKVCAGPSIFDLASFLERFDLLISEDESRPVYARQDSPIDEETIIDSYMLLMKSKLGAQFDARAMRQALPAARCLQVILHWFPHFAGWFDQMPDPYTWQRVNRMNVEELQDRSLNTLLVYRPFLKRVFRRFLQSYRML